MGKARLTKVYLIVNNAGQQMFALTVYFGVIAFNADLRGYLFNAVVPDPYVLYGSPSFIDHRNIFDEVILHVAKIAISH